MQRVTPGYSFSRRRKAKSAQFPPCGLGQPRKVLKTVVPSCRCDSGALPKGPALTCHGSGGTERGPPMSGTHPSRAPLTSYRDAVTELLEGGREVRRRRGRNRRRGRTDAETRRPPCGCSPSRCATRPSSSSTPAPISPPSSSGRQRDERSSARTQARPEPGGRDTLRALPVGNQTRKRSPRRRPTPARVRRQWLPGAAAQDQLRRACRSAAQRPLKVSAGSLQRTVRCKARVLAPSPSGAFA